MIMGASLAVRPDWSSPFTHTVAAIGAYRILTPWPEPAKDDVNG